MQLQKAWFWGTRLGCILLAWGYLHAAVEHPTNKKQRRSTETLHHRGGSPSSFTHLFVSQIIYPYKDGCGRMMQQLAAHPRPLGPVLGSLSGGCVTDSGPRATHQLPTQTC